MSDIRNNVYVAIMAGGAGTRFWPASREDFPKQLLQLSGPRSMLQATVDRLTGFCRPEQVLIVTNQRLVDKIRQQLPELPPENVIGEPAKRDTAPCIALAASMIAAQNPNALMVVMPADHIITPLASFQSSLVHAIKLVADDPQQIVTMGIKPTYPAEVFGYIERSEPLLPDSDYPTYRVTRFREKPDARTAATFLQDGKYYWNSGIFVWTTRTILDAIERHAPQIAAPIRRIAASIGRTEFEGVLRAEFESIPAISIDYAIMERYPKVCVVEAPFEWDDLGNWTALPAIRGSDAAGNTVDARHLNIDSTDCIVFSQEDHLIVTIGLQDCIVVHTEDATLVANRQNESSIKKIVETLKQRGWKQFL